MDWIERWFGLNPDGGDGSLEMLLLVGLLVCVATAVLGFLPSGRRALRAATRTIRGLKR